MPISKSDLEHDVVRAVIEHYKDCESKIRIVTMQAALFVLKWQEVEKLSSELIQKFGNGQREQMPKQIKQSATTLLKDAPPYAWELLERLANAAIRPHGRSDEEHAAFLAADVAAAKALLSAYWNSF